MQSLDYKLKTSNTNYVTARYFPSSLSSFSPATLRVCRIPLTSGTSSTPSRLRSPSESETRTPPTRWRRLRTLPVSSRGSRSSQAVHDRKEARSAKKRSLQRGVLCKEECSAKERALQRSMLCLHRARS